MIEHCGTVWGFRGCSYLYAIFSADHAYIGETGNLPAARWGSHLSKADSSFAEKLKIELEASSSQPYEKEFVYIGLYCKVIDLEEESKRKFARLAIEDELHRQFYLNENSFGSPKKLLSRSSQRSSRLSFGFDVESFAKYAIHTIIGEYKKYLELAASQ
ncbi:GIY-YIG nuclease family protein [Pseudomonas aeruginosa]|uniref:GIY-YIG nuclease family protein n=1 Tax=Pseudomonas aeruginosa TaxID=287 RepID=UPI003A4DC881